MPPNGYFKAMREVCDRHDIMMVADEVITGFGRTGHMWGSEAFGLEPDLISCAKQLTSAYVPLSAALLPKHIYHCNLPLKGCPSSGPKGPLGATKGRLGGPKVTIGDPQGTLGPSLQGPLLCMAKPWPEIQCLVIFWVHWAPCKPLGPGPQAPCSWAGARTKGFKGGPLPIFQTEWGWRSVRGR